jgi:hypothetical protein
MGKSSMFSMARFPTEGPRWSEDFPRRFPNENGGPAAGRSVKEFGSIALRYPYERRALQLQCGSHGAVVG